MFDFFISSFLALVAIINPLIVLPPFLGLVGGDSSEVMADVARKSCMVAAGILCSFILFGGQLLEGLGISHGALVVAGGILLLRAGFGMVSGTTEEEEAATSIQPSRSKKNVARALEVAVFPLAFPVITGPAAISVVLAKLSSSGGGWANTMAMAAAVISVVGISYISLVFAQPISKMLGKSTINIMQRIIGLLLSALACQMVISGIGKSVSDYTKQERAQENISAS